MIRNVVAVLLAPLLALSFPLVAPNAHAQATQVLPDFADLAERAGPAVVNIRTTARRRGRVIVRDFGGVTISEAAGTFQINRVPVLTLGAAALRQSR